MFLIRPIRSEDASALKHLANEAYLGLTNLPKDDAILERRIADSRAIFDHPATSTGKEMYSFVLEEVESGKIVGTSGIFARTATAEPSYCYRIELHQRLLCSSKSSWTERLLIPEEIRNGPSEICSLYLLKPYRKTGIGRLLSLARFLFMRLFPERFEKTVIAEMRGVSARGDICPFWDAVGRHFTEMSFSQALEAFIHDRHLACEILPEHPLYISLLPHPAQESIGLAHPNTRPALQMLEREGLRFTRQVDIFDAGPTIKGTISELRTVKESQLMRVGSICASNLVGTKVLMSNKRIDFRAVMSEIALDQERGLATISSSAASALNVGIGDEILFVSTGNS